MTTFLMISLFILLLLGFPMFIVILLPTFLSLNIFQGHISSYSLIHRVVAGVSPFPLVAVPLFIFAADIMLEGKMSQSLIDFAEKMIGHLPGGLAHTTTLACMIFGAVSGSTQAAVAAIGTNMKPAMMKRGYSEPFSIALIVNASDVSQLIPPSIFMIMFGVITGTSVAALFIAGIIPGILLGLSFMVYSAFWAKRNNVKIVERSSVKELLAATVKAFPTLGLAILIIGGIYSGIFSPTEAAGIAVGYAFVFTVIIKRRLSLKDIYKISRKSATTTGLVFILVGAAEAFAWVLTIARIPRMITELMIGLTTSPIMFLFLMNVIFFVALMLFNPLSAMVVLTPLFFPVAQTYGIDPLHLGALITLNAAIGSATPPFGVDLFTACAIFDLPYERVVKGVPPFILMGLIVLIILTIFPSITTFLPSLAF